jgi:hypothetical protein
MEAKEKAKELVNKFIPLCGMELTEIQCALIAVDELIFNAHNNYMEKYWEEVKQEIINL